MLNNLKNNLIVLKKLLLIGITNKAMLTGTTNKNLKTSDTTQKTKLLDSFISLVYWHNKYQLSKAYIHWEEDAYWHHNFMYCLLALRDF